MISEGFSKRPALENKATETPGPKTGVIEKEKEGIKEKILEFARRFFRPLDEYPKPPESFPPKGF